MGPCKHLDHSAAYAESCELVQLEGFAVPVKHWRRKSVPYEGAAVNVQFCGEGRGRINSIFACYNEGEMPCYKQAVGQPAEVPANA